MAQQTMYPGKVNSPQTELTQAISDTDTSISVLDASKLPAAPNLATIGNGEDAETILYTGVSGNDLTGVTRGFQGVAKAWSVGAKVARYFTAYDHDAFIENINTHSARHAAGGPDEITPEMIGAETPAGAQAKVDAHAAATTGVHGATSTATPNTIVQRDPNGRFKTGAPAAADDVARKAEVDAHASRTDNPHGVTKAQVGLGNVQDYGIASQAQAEAGSANNVYMTPIRVKNYVDTRLLNNLKFRSNSGQLEYEDGGVWRPVGTDFSSMTPGFVQGSTTGTIETTLVSISGSGILVSINQSLSGTSVYDGRVKVVLDGMTLIDPINAFASTSGGSTGIELMAKFNNSLLVTHKSAGSSGSSQVHTKVAYLLK